MPNPSIIIAQVEGSGTAIVKAGVMSTSLVKYIPEKSLDE
jgi:hypothetical protein